MLAEIGDVKRSARVRRAGEGRRVQADGLRPPGLQELRPAGEDHQADRRRGVRGDGPQPAARHRARAGEDRARGRVLRQPQALPERRLLLGDHLPGARPAGGDVPGHVRDPADGRLARAVARAGRRSRSRRSRGRARSTSARASGTTCRSHVARPRTIWSARCRRVRTARQVCRQSARGYAPRRGPSRLQERRARAHRRLPRLRRERRRAPERLRRLRPARSAGRHGAGPRDEGEARLRGGVSRTRWSSPGPQRVEPSCAHFPAAAAAASRTSPTRRRPPPRRRRSATRSSGSAASPTRRSSRSSRPSRSSTTATSSSTRSRTRRGAPRSASTGPAAGTRCSRSSAAG